MTADLPYVPLTQWQREYLSKFDNIIHWTSGNVIIMFQGKCANTAIKAAILEASGGIDKTVNIHADPRLDYVSRDYAIKYRGTVPVLAVVRRPWDRIVSFWRDKVAGRTPEQFTCTYVPGAYADMPFPAFVEAVLMGGMPKGDLAPAHPFLTAHGLPIPRETIKFEDLISGPGWKTFKRWTAKAWDLPDKLPHFNRPRVAKPLLDAETEQRLRLAVYAHYYTDYKLFGWNA